jgi:hypothetical protein
MSNYSDIADGLRTVLEAGVTDLSVFSFVPDAVNSFPAVVIVPETIDVEITFGGNSIEPSFRCIFLTASGDAESGFSTMYDYLDPTESNKSVIAAGRRDNPVH